MKIRVASILFCIACYILVGWFLWWDLGMTWEMARALIVMQVLCILAYMDYHTMLLPLDIIVAAIVPALLITVITGQGWLDAGLALVAFFLMFLLSKATRGAVGDGDAMVIGLVGLYMGWSMMLVVTMMALFMTAIIGIVIMIMKRGDRRSVLPFVPFLALAQGLVLIV